MSELISASSQFLICRGLLTAVLLLSYNQFDILRKIWKNFKPFLSNHEISFEIFKALIRKDTKLRQGDPIIIDWSESATFSEQSLPSVLLMSR